MRLLNGKTLPRKVRQSAIIRRYFAMFSRYSSRSALRNSRTFSTFQVVADSFVQIHSATGLPWLVLIPTTTFALRTIFTLPLSIWQRKRVVQQQELRKVVQSVPPVVKLRLASVASRANEESLSSSGTVNSKEDITKLINNQRQRLTPQQITMLALKEMRNRQKNLFKKYNVQMWKNIVLPLVQVPLWITISMGIRKLSESKITDSNLPHNHVLQELVETDWVTTIGSLDLSLPLDSAPMLLPMILGTISMINVEYNGKMMQATMITNSGIKTAMDTSSRAAHTLNSILSATRLGTIFMIGISTQTSVLLTLYWISSQAYSLIQNRILDWLWPYQR